MERELYREVEQTGYVHHSLPVHLEHRLELDMAGKKVLDRKVLWSDGTLENVYHTGSGEVGVCRGGGLHGGAALTMRAPTGGRTGVVTPMEDVTNVPNPGIIRAHIRLDGADIRQYNRLSCWVKPDYSAGENVQIILAIVNEGEERIPDKFWREGLHIVMVRNHEWNRILWEIPDLPRDRVKEVFIYEYLRGGSDPDEEVYFLIDDVALERVEHAEYARGWAAGYDMISYSTAGYDIRGKKTAITTADAGRFALRSAADDSVALGGDIQRISNKKGSFGVIDFSPVSTEGTYYLEVAGTRTHAFPISGDVIEDTVWRTLNAIFCNRCGYPVAGHHGSCHHDLFAKHNGVLLPYAGAWHDQFSTQSNEITQALFEAASHLDRSSQFYLRLMEEAEWGLDFALRVRFGDGYRATCAGWMSTGEVADSAVRVHNHPVDNFISAGVLAYAAVALRERDGERAGAALAAAREDYRFAAEIYAEKGFFTPPLRYEHTYNTSESLFYAMAGIASSRLYEATGEEAYAAKAREFAGLMLQCQETDRAVCPIPGFFYRDRSRKTTVHFNHQAREHLFMESLVLLCRAQRGHASLPVWETAMRLYGEYLKQMAKYSAPYGMAPAGVYAMDETDDRELFERMHPGMHPYVRYDDERENLIQQIKAGEKLNDRFYVRCFPVWFSFRGNNMVLLESGKAATLLGGYFGDEELTQIGREQIYWIYGKNPFNQSLMFGAGHRYGPMGASCQTGLLPLGIESRGNEDAPYFPHGNNGTYREVWTAPSKSLLLVAADLL